MCIYITEKSTGECYRNEVRDAWKTIQILVSNADEALAELVLTGKDVPEDEYEFFKSCFSSRS